MKIYIVVRDLGDGDTGLSFFSTKEKAEKYMFHREECWYEGNPHEITVDENFKFNDDE